MRYNFPAIYQLLVATFDDEALTIFCYDYFRTPYETFVPKMPRNQKVRALLGYCHRVNQIPDLLSQIQRIKPKQYARFEAQLYTPTPETSSPPKPKRNPFRYLRPVSPAEFLGRWSMVAEIALDLTLDEGDSHACIGGRRFGKSSLLIMLHHRLQQFRVGEGDYLILPLLIDLNLDFTSTITFFTHILRKVYRQVDIDVASSSADDSAWMKAPLAPDLLDNFPTEDSPDLTFLKFKEILGHILDQLYQVYGPTRLVLLLDEVDKILTHSWHYALFNQLRSLTYIGDLADKVRLVMAGSQHFLDEVTDRGSPLWNILKLNYLTAFDESAIKQLIARADSLPPATQGAVWWQSGGHPFLAQYLLHHLWKIGADRINEETVDQLVNRFLHEEERHLEGWARALGMTGLKIYRHFVHQPGWLEEIDLIRDLNEAKIPVKKGLVALVYHGLVIHDGYWSRYRRAGDLFQTWFSAHLPQSQDRTT